MTHQEDKKLTKRGVQRLLKLADYLETNVKPKDFDINSWMYDTGNLCGTTCCAFGWAAYSKLFKGLTLDSCDIPWLVDKDGEELIGFYAASHVFKITRGQAEFLFSPNYYAADYPRLATVIGRIRTFVNDNGRIHDKQWRNGYA